MDKIKKYVECYIPTETCNFRCHYCYITQNNKFHSQIAKMSHSLSKMKEALSQKRWGGTCLFNLCAGGETLIADDVIDVTRMLLEEGHYVMIVTNGSLSHQFQKISQFPQELLHHLIFKFSFHYLELVRLHLLDTFFDNVKRMKEAGASFTVEITPNDELEPYIEEIKKIAMDRLGALPHVTIGRKDSGEIPILTEHSREEYCRIWETFQSDLFMYKKSVFGEKRKEFCYAGDWSVYLNLVTGEVRQCYCGATIDNIYRNTNEPIHFLAIGNFCSQPHCYNAHAFLTLGDIPELNAPSYDELRNRKCKDGSEWLQTDMKNFMHSKLIESNTEYTKEQKERVNKWNYHFWRRNQLKKKIKKWIGKSK